MRLAGHYERLGTERAFEVLARAKALEAQGRTVIHLEIGEPDFDTPPHVVEAGAQALREGHTHYCPAPGLPELRDAAAEHLSRTRGVTVDPARVLVAPGAKWFLFFGVLAVAGEGDEVIYPNPGYPIYESAINWSGAKAVPLPITEETGFAFTASDLAERLTPRTRMVILNSPANPTGGALDRELNSQIAEILADHDCWILSDEIYSELLYEGVHDSITAHGLLDRTILLYGFPNVTATGIDERTLATRLLDEAGVAVLAGTDFGAYGAGHIRLSYANSLEHLQEALEHMSGLLEAVAV